MAAMQVEKCSSIIERLELISTNVSQACQNVKRDPNEVKIVSVSKKFPSSNVEQAYKIGLRHFGENYIQECHMKMRQCAHLQEIQWHFIGHLQSNKIKFLIQPNLQIDSLDNLRHASIIDREAQKKGLCIPVLIQVNVAGEQQKSGCHLEELSELVSAIRSLPSIKLRGLMMIAPQQSEPETNRLFFKQLFHLTQTYHLEEISMGMSQDYMQAIEEGATMIRIGTALFGSRT